VERGIGLKEIRGGWTEKKGGGGRGSRKRKIDGGSLGGEKSKFGKKTRRGGQVEGKEKNFARRNRTQACGSFTKERLWESPCAGLRDGNTKRET